MHRLPKPFWRFCRAQASWVRWPSCSSAVLPCATDPIATFDTSLGQFQVELYAQTAPQTVANFLSYVDSGAYNDTFIHRVATLADTGLAVVQGGGYKVSGAPFAIYPPVNGPVHITTNGTVPNEFSPVFPDSVGTIAMAKQSGAPNSATSEWFFNTSDNSQSLGATNDGGFTVFGRVLGNGMAIINEIQQMPRLSDVVTTAYVDNVYNNLSAADQQVLGTLAQTPLTNFNFSTATSIAANNLVTVNSITVTTITGDANLDGIVNGLDIALADSHWQQTGTNDVLGDTNHDLSVTGADFAVITSNWLHMLAGATGGGAAADNGAVPGSGSTSASVAAVPEPSAWVCATSGVALLLASRGLRSRVRKCLSLAGHPLSLVRRHLVVDPCPRGMSETTCSK